MYRRASSRGFRSGPLEQVGREMGESIRRVRLAALLTLLASQTCQLRFALGLRHHP